MKELNDINFLLQRDLRESKIPQIGKESWITIYNSLHNEIENSGFYCALIPSNKLEKSSSNHSWDLMVGNGMPGFSASAKISD